jgi:GGDEF domain-containing protein
VVVGAEAGCSVGVAELGLDEEPDRWIHRADRAMYQAKADGGGVILADEMGGTQESSVIRAVLRTPAVKS